MSCEICIANQERDDRCDVCCGPFDGWHMSHTTTQCECGEVYQVVWQMCEACERDPSEYEVGGGMRWLPARVVRDPRTGEQRVAPAAWAFVDGWETEP